MDKKIIKFDHTEIEEYEFHQYKSPISINEISFLLVNKILNISFVTKIIKSLYAYSFQRRMHIE